MQAMLFMLSFFCYCYCYCNKVGRWSPRPVLQHPAHKLQHPASMGFRKYFGCWRTGHGGPRPTMVCLAALAL